MLPFFSSCITAIHCYNFFKLEVYPLPSLLTHSCLVSYTWRHYLFPSIKSGCNLLNNNFFLFGFFWGNFKEERASVMLPGNFSWLSRKLILWIFQAISWLLTASFCIKNIQLVVLTPQDFTEGPPRRYRRRSHVGVPLMRECCGMGVAQVSTASKNFRAILGKAGVRLKFFAF